MAHPLAKPTPEQVAWQDLEMGMFLHWSPATYENSETGLDRRITPLSSINPHLLDTDQWVDVALSMGCTYIVMVAKHVGGFCVWQTETSDYGVRQTPWRDGKGDMMADLAASCKRRGIKLGVYLSPADGHLGAQVGGACATPEKSVEYARIYRQQLTEVLTRYGEMCEVWFDGSNVIEVGDLLEEYAPKAMVFQSPHATIRWVGNEDGMATYPAWNALSKDEAVSGIATHQHGTPDGDAWMPLECDARIRAQWFWTEDNEQTLKSLDHLMNMYYRSVGNGAVLLLNHTPDTTGLIPLADVIRAREFGEEIRKRFSKPLAETQGTGFQMELHLPGVMPVDHVVLMEDIAEGERIRGYAVEGWDGQGWQILCRGSAVGHKRIECFPPKPVSKLRLHCHKVAATPILRKFAAFHAGVSRLESAPEVSRDSLLVGEWGPEIFYGRPWRDGVDLTYDLTHAIDDAGQYTLEFLELEGMDGYEPAVLSVIVQGIEYPRWVSGTGHREAYNLSIPSVSDSIQVKVKIKGLRGKDSRGKIYISRRGPE